MQTITWIEPTQGDPALADLWSFLREQVAVLAAGRVKTQMIHAPVAAGGIRTMANRLMSDAAILSASLEAEADSDALVLGCWGAPTAAVRAAVGVPVSSLPDGSVRAVGSLAKRAVLVTVAQSLVPIFVDDLSAHGASQFLRERPVRAYDPETNHLDVLRAVAQPGAIIDHFDAAAQRAVDDGADAIVVGCGYLGPIFAANGYSSVRKHPDVPVLDCNRLAFEHALHLLRLSDSGIGPTPRGYVRPSGARAEALAAVAARLRPTADSTAAGWQGR
ncbi:aspartate/glutamate racemase family protein [Arthrobacter sp. 18067]|uniref:aspartate/glutamate racemase family protein n=1 Tax=Arthrobacter sp. 18067 TaxID=2681413 RepID=UPI00135C57D2|nr:aspartate/glutamate racemase family protein [Arthrobacter sp. 18067]